MILVLWSTACNTADSTQHAKPQNPIISALTFYPGTSKTSATECSLSHTNRCQVCFDDGQLRVPHEDVRCPLQDCGVLNSLELQKEGLEQVCLEHRYDDPVFACSPEGTCAKEASVDVANARPQRLWHARTDPVPLSKGCHEGGTVGFRWAKDGTLCPGGRALQDNAFLTERPCPIPSYHHKCAIFPAAAPFCKEGRITAILTTVSLGSRRRVIGPVLKFVRHWRSMPQRVGMMRAIPANAKTAMDATFESGQICRCEVPSYGMRLAVPGKLPTPDSHHNF